MHQKIGGNNLFYLEKDNYFEDCKQGLLKKNFYHFYFFLEVHVIQKIINWSDKKMVLVPSVKQTPKEPLGNSTRS